MRVDSSGSVLRMTCGWFRFSARRSSDFHAPIACSTFGLLARLSGATRDEADRASRDELSGEAVEVAERLGDPGELVARAGRSMVCTLGPGHGRRAAQHLCIGDRHR